MDYGMDARDMIRAKNKAAAAVFRAHVLCYRRRLAGMTPTGYGPLPDEWEARLAELEAAHAETLAPIRAHQRARAEALDVELEAVAVEILPMLEVEAKERQGQRTDLTSVKELTEVEPQRATQQAGLHDTPLTQEQEEWVSTVLSKPSPREPQASVGDRF